MQEQLPEKSYGEKEMYPAPTSSYSCATKYYKICGRGRVKTAAEARNLL